MQKVHWKVNRGLVSEFFCGRIFCIERPRLWDEVPLMEPLDERESVDPLLDVPRLLVVDLWRRLRGIFSSLENVPLRPPAFCQISCQRSRLTMTY